MQKHIHPEYRPVVFRDREAGLSFLTRSTAAPDRTVVWEDGKEYPVVDVEISAASHPVFTGDTSRARVLDVAGRVEKYRRRYGRSGRPVSARPGPDSTDSWR